MRLIIARIYMEEPLIGESRNKAQKSIYETYVSHNWKSAEKTRDFYIRLIGVVLAVIVVGVFSRVERDPVSRAKCMNDAGFDLTNGINVYFRDNAEVKNFVIILSSFFLDVNLLFFLTIYGLYGDSWKPVIFFACFYIIRAILQGSTILGFPEGFVWGFPGIYSLAITYVRSSDFFYSGHVGVMLFLGMFFYDKGYLKLFYYSIFCCLFEGCVMVLVRCHYSIDIIGGILFAHYLWTVSDWISKITDKYSGYGHINS